MRYVPSKMVSKLDLPGQKNLKLRADGQGNAAEVAAKDLKAALAEKEHAHFLKNGGVAQEEDFEEQKQADLKLLEHLTNIPGTSSGSGGQNGRKERMTLVPNAADADLEDSDDEDDSDSEDDDDEEELLAELEKIKRERAEEAAKRVAQEATEVEEAERAELMGGNPLLAEKLAAAAAAGGGGSGGGASFALKRRWDEDVVFRNQARGEPKQQRRFINDTIRSDFHRRFLDKYLK